MNILEVTSREFRENQKAYFEIVDQGDRVIIKRGKKHSYLLMPIEPKEYKISEGMELKINDAIKEAAEGKTINVKTKERLDELLKSL
ncbi:prevent-host-death protein [Sandaracinomonas limnophila]|uniref:Prevent-host-death protein n=1 Tax=Sandaracinomonas limnophila TaxID=1862386 RepID=A0A437PPQ4_9BACT|nr:prevent-host-death protein [Sandaracinomonas limnophila]RVU24253.1 prevent-host-death protein [Sandaracinomonas limnophila]